MKTIIIGLGNPILGDDGVGWKVVETLRTNAYLSPHPVLETASLGGLSLMERMVGYQRAILVDSMETGQSPEGSVNVFPLEALTNPSASHSSAAHDTSLLTALEVGRKMKMQVPDAVTVVAIEAKNVYDFSEELSPAVAEAVPLAVQSVIQLLKEEP